jgi:hypothetical protein
MDEPDTRTSERTKSYLDRDLCNKNNEVGHILALLDWESDPIKSGYGRVGWIIHSYGK